MYTSSMIKLGKWRQFRPRLVPVNPAAVAQGGHTSLEKAEEIAVTLLKQNTSIEGAVDTLKAQIQITSTAPRLIALALLMTPEASHAQAMMDVHKHNFHDRKARLFELIDFNDTFVAGVLAMPRSEHKGFADLFHQAQQRLSKAYKTALFTDGQWHAILHGLSREIAVYLAAVDEGFDAIMTTRTDDAFGVDMQIRERETGRYVNIDCKTHSSFFFRLKELVRERRMTPGDAAQAQELGSCRIENCRDNRCVGVVLLRIDHTILGEITDFSFEDTTKIGQTLGEVVTKYGTSDSGYGHSIAPL